MDKNILEIFKARVQENCEKITEVQKAYLIAKAEEETIKEIAEDIQRKILASGNYTVCDEFTNHRGVNNRITAPQCTYLMDEEIFINDFLEKCYTEYKKAGIADPRGKEYCPEGEAHEKKKQAENELLKIAIDILPDEMQEEKAALKKASTHWKYRGQILDLILRLEATTEK